VVLKPEHAKTPIPNGRSTEVCKNIPGKMGRREQSPSDSIFDASPLFSPAQKSRYEKEKKGSILRESERERVREGGGDPKVI
jgi:hypothetical protein